MTAAELIARARALLAAATPGPWTAWHDKRGRTWWVDSGSVPDSRMSSAVAETGEHERGPEDAALIAAAPTLIAELCEVLERLACWDARTIDEQQSEIDRLRYYSRQREDFVRELIGRVDGLEQEGNAARAEIELKSKVISDFARRQASLISERDEVRAEVERLQDALDPGCDCPACGNARQKALEPTNE